MKELNPNKLHVTFQDGASPKDLSMPRRYTLTHSDTTGDLFLTIGAEYEQKQLSGFYTRLMRDEVLAEWKENDGGLSLNVYCHVSGGFVFGGAGWRFEIFHHHLPMVLEAMRYGDRELYATSPELNRALVKVHFQSTQAGYNKIEEWGLMQEYE